MRSVIPWSWSSWESYNTCPRAFYEIKIAKNYKEDWERDYILWGNKVHKALEERVLHGKPLPENMRQWEPMSAKLEAAPGMKFAELETAITADLKPTGYWDDDCWSRGKEDLVIVNGDKAIDIDYKTGKPKRTTTQQLEISAVRVMIKFPQVNVVHTAFSWLTNKTWSRATYTRDDIPKIVEDFKDKISDMEWSQQNNTWPARPSGLCKKSRKPGSTYAGCIVASCPHSEYYKK